MWWTKRRPRPTLISAAAPPKPFAQAGWSVWATSVSPDQRYMVLRETFDQPGDEATVFQKQRLRVVALASGRAVYSEVGEVLTPTSGTLHWDPQGLLLIRGAVVNHYNARCLYQWNRRRRRAWQRESFLKTPMLGRSSLVKLARRPGARTYALTVRHGCDLGSGEVVLLDAQLNPKKLLTSDALDDGSPIWSADGKWLVWRRQPRVNNEAKGDGSLHRSDAEGKVVEALWIPGQDQSVTPLVAWPTGNWIVVVRHVTGGGEAVLGVVDAAVGGGFWPLATPSPGLESLIP